MLLCKDMLFRGFLTPRGQQQMSHCKCKGKHSVCIDNPTGSWTSSFLISKSQMDLIHLRNCPTQGAPGVGLDRGDTAHGITHTAHGRPTPSFSLRYTQQRPGLARRTRTSSSAVACKLSPPLLPGRVVSSDKILQGEKVSCLCVLVGGGPPVALAPS